MLIDEFLPEYQFSERHQVKINANPKDVYAEVLNLNLGDSKIIRSLLWLRRLPGLLLGKDRVKVNSRLDLNAIIKLGFILLGENPDKELLLGFAGKFWSLHDDPPKLDPEGFLKFNKKGSAKAAWNFSLFQEANNVTRLVTETRVHCLDKTSRRLFRMYWLLIRPFSGLIRIILLRIIKKKTENRVD